MEIPLTIETTFNLQRTNISHHGKRRIIDSKVPLNGDGDMLVPIGVPQGTTSMRKTRLGFKGRARVGNPLMVHHPWQLC